MSERSTAAEVAPGAHRALRALVTALGASLFLVFLALLAVGVAAHEPWFDEAQSWLLARDASVAELLTTYLRYEGHPPLWYLLLALPAKLGLPYQTVNVVSALVAACGVLLLLLERTTPLAIRALLPFTYFVAYQYTIVSRSYVLVLPLLLLVLRLYPERRRRLGTFTLLLALLSQVSLHGMSLAGALALLYALDLWPERRTLSPAEIRKHAVCAAALVANVAFVALVLLPPADLAIRAKLDLSFSPLAMLRIGWLSLSSGVAGPNALSLAALLVLALWFWRRKTLLPFLLLVGSLLPISTVYFNRWHEGLFFLALVFVALLTFQRAAAHPATGRERWLERAALALLLLVLLRHASWTARSYRYDFEAAFSGSQEAADYIAAHGLDQRRLFGAGFPALAVQPYFERNVFANYTTSGGFSFWDWSTRAPWFYRPGILLRRAELEAWMAEQLAERPEFVLVSRKFPYDVWSSQVVERDGRYRLVRTFEGAMFWKERVVESESFELYELTP